MLLSLYPRRRFLITPQATLEEIAADGFSLETSGRRLTDLSLLSLRTALKAYFSTYQTMRYSLHLFNPTRDLVDALSDIEVDGLREDPQDIIDFNHSTNYFEAATETILHFQHFSELILKDILREVHPLLAHQAKKTPIALYKLLKNEPLTENQMVNLKSVEFDVARERLMALISEKKIDPEYHFIKDFNKCLLKLNFLRNRLWHRGTYILRYPALDQLIGLHVLPFVQKIVALPKYKDKSWAWTSKLLECGLDPIHEIVLAAKEQNIDYRKIAFLKELGRASYSNPFHQSRMARSLDRGRRIRSEKLAQNEKQLNNVSSVKKCPVCSSLTLLVFDELNIEEYDDTEHSYEKAYRYTYQVECRVCTFSVDHQLENATHYGFPIEDYWEGSELGRDRPPSG
jgi:hypothetical protein